MNPNRSTDTTSTPRRSTRLRASLAALVALTMGVGTAGLVAATSGTASASTLNGVATIESASGTALTSGGSTTQFTLGLPAGAACTGDTATGGYHIYSYLVPLGTALSSVTFIQHPSSGFGLFDSTGSYYGPVNTAIGTGQIVGIPNDFEWGPYIAANPSALSTLLYSANDSGAWEGGLVCANKSGVVTDNWNTEIDFAAIPGAPSSLVWSDTPGTPSLFRILTKAIPSATPGTAYSITLQATGGTTPYKWKKLTAPPKGLKVSSAGVISGTISAKTGKAGTYSFSVEASDSTKKTKKTATVTLSITVN
jgi:hypothetical protein